MPVKLCIIARYFETNSLFSLPRDVLHNFKFKASNTQLKSVQSHAGIIKIYITRIASARPAPAPAPAPV